MNRTFNILFTCTKCFSWHLLEIHIALRLQLVRTEMQSLFRDWIMIQLNLPQMLIFAIRAEIFMHPRYVCKQCRPAYTCTHSYDQSHAYGVQWNLCNAYHRTPARQLISLSRPDNQIINNFPRVFNLSVLCMSTDDRQPTTDYETFQIQIWPTFQLKRLGRDSPFCCIAAQAN